MNLTGAGNFPGNNEGTYISQVLELANGTFLMCALSVGYHNYTTAHPQLPSYMTFDQRARVATHHCPPTFARDNYASSLDWPFWLGYIDPLKLLSGALTLLG